jgi:hypothetical protein
VFDIDEEISDEEVEQWFQLKAPPTMNADGTNRNGSSRLNANLYATKLFNCFICLDKEYRHPVRAEPFSKSKVVGFLIAGVTVVATADCGDWLKVKSHTSSVGDAEKQPGIAESSDRQWGWCLRRFKSHEFLTSANGIIIDDLSEAMKYKSHYSVGNKQNNTKDEDEREKKESKAKQLAESISHGKENKSSIPAKSMKDVDHLSPLQHLPTASSSSSFSPNSNAQYSPPPPLARCNSIRLPPIDSPTKPLDVSSSSNNNNKTNIKSSQKKASVSKKKEMIVDVEVWIELKDESEHLYYYNAATKQSKWEPPEWIQVIFYIF